jgi:hypothetical protein
MGILHKIDELLDGEVFADGPAALRTKIADAHQPVAVSLAGAKTEGVVDHAAEFHALGKITAISGGRMAAQPCSV